MKSYAVYTTLLSYWIDNRYQIYNPKIIKSGILGVCWIVDDNDYLMWSTISSLILQRKNISEIWNMLTTTEIIWDVFRNGMALHLKTPVFKICLL